MRVALLLQRFRCPRGDLGIGPASVAVAPRRDLPKAELALFDATHRQSHADPPDRLAAFAPGICFVHSDTLMFADALRVAGACCGFGSSK